ncbi:MAG: 30S ribosomal protein S9 [Candidatus Lokiarchaeota archaeon]|nr:30S ribosomal protein S9 [Candidatus Lokiarchaeota archaeon]MBD3341308.1 30S ribosomal protein S9 [Candidatus Lokiarchaeota archaeon]
MSEKVKNIQSSGKRKRAIARAILKYPSKGQVRINNVPLDIYEPVIARYRIQEVLDVARHPKLEKCDINIKVNGGGIMGQTDAVRISIARAIVKFLGTKKIESIFREYDDSLLSGDSRRTEPKKFGGKKARARRQKSFR